MVAAGPAGHADEPGTRRRPAGARQQREAAAGNSGTRAGYKSAPPHAGGILGCMREERMAQR